MAVKISKIGQTIRSSIGKDGRTSYTTKTSSRKTFAKDQVRSYDKDVDVVSNEEHFVNQASDLSVVSKAIDSIAATARNALKNVRDEITSVSVSDDKKGNFNDTDVSFARDSFINRTSRESYLNDEEIKAVKSLVNEGTTSTFDIKQQSNVALFNSVIPDIESVTLDVDKSKGMIDAFYARIKFNVQNDKISDGTIKAIRIFKCTILNPDFMNNICRMSFHGIDRILSNNNRSRSKNNDQLLQLEKRLLESGVDNSLSALSPRDDITKLRVGSSINEMSSKSDVISLQPINDDVMESSTSPYLSKTSKLDRSVIDDVNSIKNLQNENPSVVTEVENTETIVGKSISNISKMGFEHLRQLKDEFNDKNVSMFAITNNNSQEFKEIAFVSPDKLTSRIVGDRIEFIFDDPSVCYGRAYRYYITLVDNNLHESVRTRIVELSVNSKRVPACPKRITANIVNDFVHLSMIVDDQLVEKFEIYRRESDSTFYRNSKFKISHVSGISGFVKQDDVKERNSNGFVLLGESLNAINGSNFYDRSVIVGVKYLYRIYCVDIFGNKSEKPREIEVYVMDKKFKIVDLDSPSLLAEVDVNTNKMKLTFQCQDKRVVSLFLARRDLTLKQSAFVVPGQVSILKFGHVDAGNGQRRFEDVHLFDQSIDISWNGRFENNGEKIIFVDHTAEYDHVYQYKMYGVDRFGNSTSHRLSNMVMVTRRSIVNSPFDVKAELRKNTNGYVDGVLLSWKDGNIDISSEDMLGNQEDLANSSVRTLFQIERTRLGEQKWEEFPLISSKSFIDDVKETESPNFRPSYVRLNETYVYRVKALQTGSYVSNFSNQVSIFVTNDVLSPINLKLRTCDSKIRPFYVTINWDTDDKSGVIDKWIIERAEVNNIAAARLNIRNKDDFLNLSFCQFREVFKESSRSRSDVADSFQKFTSVSKSEISLNLDDSTMIGQHHFSDMSVVFGNSYFYRIRSVGLDGKMSDWSYAAIKLTDESFEKKQNSLLTSKEKNMLAVSFNKMVLDPQSDIGNDSFSLIPDFAKSSKPKMTRSVEAAEISSRAEITFMNPSISFYNKTTRFNKLVPTSAFRRNKI